MTKILYIGLAESSHTASWIDLLQNSEFDYALFGLPTGALPASKTIPTYMSDRRARRGAQNYNLLSLPAPQTLMSIFLNFTLRLLSQFQKLKRLFYRLLFRQLITLDQQKYSESLLKFKLRAFIRHFEPDIVHTLGVFPSSDLYLSLCLEFPDIPWVVQVRGGPDIELAIFDPVKTERIKTIFRQARVIVCDSESNYELASNLGADSRKFCLGVVSGSGGLDLEKFPFTEIDFKTKAESRNIVWPKVYESLTSKAAPVFEAINLAWDEIQPATFTFLWLEDKNLEFWMRRHLRPEILPSIKIFKRVSHSEALQEISKAHVLLAPSLMDGIPNVMLESMMLGTIPIVSPIPTIRSLVSDPENVIFARNLYPEEIASALVRALNEQEQNTLRIEVNRKIVTEKYNRNAIQQNLFRVYRDIK
jgi:glycosyltransferase involved in cell wall biosynthesis